MCILITGGTGFIGTRAAKKLLDSRQKVVIMDINAGTSMLEPGQGEMTVVTGDVRQFSDVTRVIRDFKVEKIINLAYLLGETSERDPLLAVEVNALGATNVFEAAMVFGIKRVVHASSLSLFGPQEFYGDRLVTEDDVPQPPRIYGATKVFNEFIASKYEERFGLEVANLRLSVVYGRGRERGRTGWVGQLISNPVLGKPVFAPVSSNQRMSLIHVDDAAELFVRLCLAEKLQHRIYHSGGHTASANELAEIVGKYLPNADIRFNEDAPDLNLIYRMDGSRIAKELDWEMMHLETGILNTINEVRMISGENPL